MTKTHRLKSDSQRPFCPLLGETPAVAAESTPRRSEQWLPGSTLAVFPADLAARRASLALPRPQSSSRSASGGAWPLLRRTSKPGGRGP
jgi:hypothetical protein